MRQVAGKEAMLGEFNGFTSGPPQPTMKVGLLQLLRLHY